ncbi:8023_t:CDS:1 [Funneliformis geosporum]|uniref:8023_t:CDS:1 n=1 Tax=Funneliformis geosporum TaxID=1117311 RepID=A0A9W4SK07_9GLOM|nr:8023_t:CDS:1 [Funneliformis geosporum]
MTFQAELDRINKTGKKDRLGQISTPSHIATFMAELIVGKDTDLTDKTVLDPCVGTGNLLISLRGRGTILVGNDVDKEALETCKQRIPEAILTNCNIFLCVNPKLVIKDSEKKMVELHEEHRKLLSKEKLDKEETKRIKKISLEVEERIKLIEENKKVKP